MTREERSKQKLMIPMMTHSIFIIEDVTKDHVVVPPYQGGIYTEEGYEAFKKSIEETVSLNKYDEEQFKKLYYWSTKKFKKSWLSEFIQKEQYEKTDCNEIDNALFM